MKYDWKRIIEEQENSGMNVTDYCQLHNLSRTQFYKVKKDLNNNNFTELNVIDESSNVISIIINGNKIEFNASLIKDVIGALK